MSEINNTKVGKVKNIDVVMSMKNLLEGGNNFWEATRRLFKYWKDELALDNTGTIVDFINDDSTNLFKFKQKITSWIGSKS